MQRFSSTSGYPRNTWQASRTDFQQRPSTPQPLVNPNRKHSQVNSHSFLLTSPKYITHIHIIFSLVSPINNKLYSSWGLGNLKKLTPTYLYIPRYLPIPIRYFLGVMPLPITPKGGTHTNDHSLTTGNRK